MKKTCFLAIAVISGLPMSSNALELGGLDVVFNPRLETGAMYYKFEGSGRSFTPEEGNPLRDEFAADNGVVTHASHSRIAFSSWMPFIGGGVTTFVNRFFVDVSAQYADKGSDIASTLQTETIIFDAPPATPGPAPASVNRISKGNNDADFDRTDLAVSVGYGVTDHLALFAGYKYGKTEFTNQRSFQRTGTECGVHLTPDPPGCMVTFKQIIVTDTEKVEYESEGPFVGFNFRTDTLSMGFLKGVLSGNIAVAFMGGRTKSTLTNGVIRTETGESFSFPADTLKLKGDTVGLSSGVTWLGTTPINGLTYSVGINGYQYDFSGDQVAPGEPGRDFKETVVDFKLGLAYLFD
jgi:hypothetical protein